jgi:hypothetical protein
MTQHSKPTLGIFVHRKTGDCILLSLGVHPKLRMITACGPLERSVSYQKETMSERLSASPFHSSGKTS